MYLVFHLPHLLSSSSVLGLGDLGETAKHYNKPLMLDTILQTRQIDKIDDKKEQLGYIYK